ncbi:hypothetical protein EDD17DRAFT_1786370 [Pisolithus thermaeus]|nr:hypothetical protein EV401DRAFT_2135790 [Pisolithus croceorrhizus]KAI6166377.1 hypothetical protein EDD17DRAFT_1786370 [Pisolithus thermaeus]
MSQHSALQPEPGPNARQIEPQSSLEEQWEKTNASIHEMVKAIQSTGIEHRELLAQTLFQIQLYSPLKALQEVTVYRDVYMDLIEGNPDIRQALESAIESGRYDQVVSLPVLRGGDDDTGDEEESTGSEEESTEDEEEITGQEITTIGAADAAWTAEYHGNYHEVMLRNINSMNRGRIYAPFAEITQSSGTGKSRTVHELAALIFTIPFNLRDPEQRELYPLGDRSVREYLCEASNVKSVNHGEARTALFFSYVFSEVAEEVKRNFTVHRATNKLHPRDLAKRWRDLLSRKTRRLLYSNIIEACKINELPSDANFRPIFRNLRRQFERLLSVLETVCDFPNSEDVRILLYFDEAHELGHAIPDDKQKKTLRDVVCSTLSYFQTSSVFTLFLSTQSSMGHFTSSTEMTQSAWQPNAKHLQAPFTEMPFDCHPTFPLKPGDFNLAQLQDLEFLARFGRPLFWSLIEASTGADKSEFAEKIMALARAKLVHSSDIGAEQSDLAMLAILDVLITIDYEPRLDLAHKCEMDMIASHMRIAFSIPQHRSYTRSGYPSEPFLAEAASRQMYRFFRHPTISMARILWKNFESGLIDLGQNGQIIMRLLLRFAYMNAIAVEQADKRYPTGEPNFSKGCSVVRLLKALFANRYHAEILMSKPDNDVSSTCSLEDAFEYAVVRFTHFIRAVDESVMNTKSMVSAFLRGAALICQNQQKTIDIIIPILLDKCSVLKESLMSALLIQVNGRRQRSSSTVNIIDEKDHDFFPNKVSMRRREDTRPYVTLVAELGVDNPPQKNSFVVTGNNDGRLSKEHPRYGIQAYTCTMAAWKVVGFTEHATYQRILGTDDFLPDHPRQDEASLGLVHQMLPFWYDNAMRYNDEDADTMDPLPKLTGEGVGTL